MQAGLLTEIISFYENQSKRDNFGSTTDNWVKVYDKRARVQFDNGARKEVVGEVINTTSNTFTIRYCKEVNEKMRIYYDRRKYRIISINRDRKQQSTVIKAELINE